VDVQLIADAANDCGGELTCEVLDVTSNEPINGPGDGDTDPDWMITDDGALKLRAERSGNLTGRIYRIHGQCVDGSGNTTEFDAEVTVPHDQGKSGK